MAQKYVPKISAILSCALLLAASVQAETVAVAVASNFVSTLREIAADYSAATGNDVRVSSGSSGHLYAQIRNGAPYDVFLSADAERPQLLEEQALALEGSRFTYALGQLVIWSRDDRFTEGDCSFAALAETGRKIAIANPRLAPYGAASKEFLQGQGLWQPLQGRLVFGENISQTLHFVASGNAGIGIIAQSQLAEAARFGPRCTLLIAADAHAPIRQQAVQLARSGDNVAASRFMSWLRGESARALISRSGYRLPEYE